MSSNVDVPQDVKMSEPYKPDDEERDYYYFGIAGKPRLVARTSHECWSRPENTGAYTGQRRKQYLAVLEYQQDELVSRWTNDLTLALVQALNECRWSYFFPIRIGLDDTLSSEFPTILLIAVEEDSLQWEQGLPIALECRKILRDFKIADVEVEIREGKYAHCAASAELERQIDPKYWANEKTNKCEKTNRFALPMLSFLGYNIGYSEDGKGEGSVGLHLRLGDKNSAVYGLTCRHVVFNGRHPSESYTVSEDHKQYHIQGGDSGFTKCLENLKIYQTQLQHLINQIQRKQKEWEDCFSHVEGREHRRPTGAEIMKLAEYQTSAAYNKQVIDLCNNISHKKDRHIGHLAFHPKMELSSERPGYLTDWGLIELDLGKFNSGPDNKVFIGTEPNDIGISESDLDNGFLSLHLEPEDGLDSRTFCVGKRGSRTGLTYGVMSSIEAVVRRPTYMTHHFAWEILIVPFGDNDDRVFSKPGDSGSSIFDASGKVIGLVTGNTVEPPYDEKGGWKGIPPTTRNPKKYPGGAARPEEADETPSGDLATWYTGTDITFATPIQWVLDDIERFTGLEPRLA